MRTDANSCIGSEGAARNEMLIFSSFSFSRQGLRKAFPPSLTTGIKTMKAADVTQHSLDVPKATLAAENPILGTWKLQSLVYETPATG